MRNLKLTLLVLFLLPASVAAQAKVGVIDFQRATLESNAGIEASATLETYYAEHEANLQEVQQQLNEAQTRYETQQRALSATALQQLENEITRLQTRLQRDAEDAEFDMQSKQAELFNPITERIQQIVLAYAEEQRFTLVLDAAAGVVYASSAADITSEVIRRMNDASVGEAEPESAPLPPETPDEPEP